MSLYSCEAGTPHAPPTPSAHAISYFWMYFYVSVHGSFSKPSTKKKTSVGVDDVFLECVSPLC